MRSISSTLIAAQKEASRRALAKIVLTFSGETTQTYTKTRIIDIAHPEQGDSQTAEVWLDNADNALTSLSLQGYKGVISYGFTTGAGKEYSATAPLWVIGQQLVSTQEGPHLLLCRLSLAGIINLMGEDHANADYSQESDDTNTLKDLIQKIAGDSGVSLLDCYDHCTPYDLVFDSEDALIDVFQPKDSFSIKRGDNRKSKINELLSYTGCVMRAEDDEKIHILVPTTTGTTYAREFSLAKGSHTFFNKTLRKRVVIPNYVQIDSHPSHDDSFTGYAEDTDSSALIEKREYKYLRLASNAQAAAIAAAILAHHKWDAETGHGSIPMDMGAEVHDYVKITDARENADSRVGNIGYLHRHYTPGVLDMEIRFGSVFPGGLAGTTPPSLGGGGGGDTNISNIYEYLDTLWEYITNIWDWIEAYSCPYEGYIHIVDGDIWFTPQSGGLTHTFANMGISETTPKFGLLKDTSNGVLYFYDKAGAYSHAFAPETTEKGKLGLSTKKWEEGHVKELHAYDELYIPAEA